MWEAKGDRKPPAVENVSPCRRLVGNSLDVVIPRRRSDNQKRRETSIFILAILTQTYILASYITMRISVRAPWVLCYPCSAVSPIIGTQWRQTYHASFQARSLSSGKHHIIFPTLLLSSIFHISKTIPSILHWAYFVLVLNISQLRPKIFAQIFFSRLFSVWISNYTNYSISFLGSYAQPWIRSIRTESFHVVLLEGALVDWLCVYAIGSHWLRKPLSGQFHAINVHFLRDYRPISVYLPWLKTEYLLADNAL